MANFSCSVDHNHNINFLVNIFSYVFNSQLSLHKIYTIACMVNIAAINHLTHCYHMHTNFTLSLNVYKIPYFKKKLSPPIIWHPQFQRVGKGDHMIIIILLFISLVPRPRPQGGKRIWGLASVFLVVHCQQSCFQVNQSDHSYSTIIIIMNR